MTCTQIEDLTKSCFGSRTELHEQAVRAVINLLLAEGYISKDEEGIYRVTKEGMAKLMREGSE